VLDAFEQHALHCERTAQPATADARAPAERRVAREGSHGRHGTGKLEVARDRTPGVEHSHDEGGRAQLEHGGAMGVLRLTAHQMESRDVLMAQRLVLGMHDRPRALRAVRERLPQIGDARRDRELGMPAAHLEAAGTGVDRAGYQVRQQLRPHGFGRALVLVALVAAPGLTAPVVDVASAQRDHVPGPPPELGRGVGEDCVPRRRRADDLSWARAFRRAVFRVVPGVHVEPRTVAEEHPARRRVRQPRVVLAHAVDQGRREHVPGEVSGAAVRVPRREGVLGLDAHERRPHDYCPPCCRLWSR